MKKGILARSMGFDSFITGELIKIAWIFYVIFIILGGLLGAAGVVIGGFVSGEAAGIAGGIVSAIILLVGIPIWLLFARIGFEVIMVVFKINENLQKLVDKEGL